MTHQEPGPRRRGATIEEVARAAGVSRQTVSNALNAPQRVREATLKRVMETIDRLGYRPDASARSAVDAQNSRRRSAGGSADAADGCGRRRAAMATEAVPELDCQGGADVDALTLEN